MKNIFGRIGFEVNEPTVVLGTASILLYTGVIYYYAGLYSACAAFPLMIFINFVYMKPDWEF